MDTLIIPADGSEVRWESTEKIDLEYLQDQVGGVIEAVEIGTDMTMYLHEEGKVLRLPRNERATRLAKRYGGIALMDFIVGDVVIVGGVDDEGYDTALTETNKGWLAIEVNRRG
jgi:hypothetical protein